MHFLNNLEYKMWRSENAIKWKRSFLLQRGVGTATQAKTREGWEMFDKIFFSGKGEINQNRLSVGKDQFWQIFQLKISIEVS